MTDITPEALEALRKAATQGEAMTNPRQALEEAFKKVFPYPGSGHYLKDEIDWAWDRKATRFRRFLDAEAWTDAAMMLVPTDGSMQLLDIEYSYEPSEPGVWSACTIRWYPPHKSGNDWHAQIESGPIPALALAQACLKARENSDG